MNFAVVCLAALATLAAASAEQPILRAGLHPIFQAERITNGLDAVPNEFPYQVSLQWRSWVLSPFSHVCGASIINEFWIVTAGHCITEIPKGGEYRAVAGAHNVNNNEATQQVRSIKYSIVHSEYKGGVNPNDIALMKLSDRLIFNDVVAPIALPAQDKVHSGNAVLSGWGSISLTSATIRPTVLQKVSIPLVDTQVCYNALNSIVRDPPLDASTLDNVCTGPLDASGISACSGDSGGPLAQLNDGVWELVGVVSWGIHPCGTRGAPSVFSRASAYNNWITKNLLLNE